MQEALTNSVRHASAQTVEIVIYERVAPEQKLHIDIQDDGRGVEEATALSGFGLRSMRERVRSLGGECVIQGAAQQGTRLSITLPYAPELQENVA